MRFWRRSADRGRSMRDVLRQFEEVAPTECLIVHAPHEWASYCETHRALILPGESDTRHLEAEPS